VACAADGEVCDPLKTRSVFSSLAQKLRTKKGPASTENSVSVARTSVARSAPMPLVSPNLLGKHLDDLADAQSGAAINAPFQKLIEVQGSFHRLPASGLEAGPITRGLAGSKELLSNPDAKAIRKSLAEHPGLFKEVWKEPKQQKKLRDFITDQLQGNRVDEARVQLLGAEAKLK